MWQRFTERARRVVFFAQEEAGNLGESYVSTEHLLLGMIRENDCAGARTLDRIGINLAEVRRQVERLIARGDTRSGQDMQLTDGAKKVIDFAYDEARQFNTNYIGTEHLLLGLIREGDGLAGRVLAELGVNLERARREVISIKEGSADALERAERSMSSLPSFDAGDLGNLISPENRLGVEVAIDAAAVRELRDVFLARDGYGYQELLDLGRVFVAATGEKVKYLVVPPGSSSEPAPTSCIFVRILEGVHEGRKGWIPTDSFARIGPDETPFPPEESSLTIDPDDMIP